MPMHSSWLLCQRCAKPYRAECLSDSTGPVPGTPRDWDKCCGQIGKPMTGTEIEKMYKDNPESDPRLKDRGWHRLEGEHRSKESDALLDLLNLEREASRKGGVFYDSWCGASMFLFVGVCRELHDSVENRAWTRDVDGLKSVTLADLRNAISRGLKGTSDDNASNRH